MYYGWKETGHYCFNFLGQLIFWWIESGWVSSCCVPNAETGFRHAPFCSVLVALYSEDEMNKGHIWPSTLLKSDSLRTAQRGYNGQLTAEALCSAGLSPFRFHPDTWVHPISCMPYFYWNLMYIISWYLYLSQCIVRRMTHFLLLCHCYFSRFLFGLTLLENVCDNPSSIFKSAHLLPLW